MYYYLLIAISKEITLKQQLDVLFIGNDFIFIDDHHIKYNNEIIEEYVAVLKRPKFNFSEETISAVIDAIREGGIDSRRIGSNELLPDPKDIVFYEVALANEDSFLVTGNIKHFPKNPFVVTPAEMLQIIQEMNSPNHGLLSEPSVRYGRK